MKKGLIIGSFGTTDRQAREKSLDKIFQDIEKEVSYPCVEAYTSRIVKKRIMDNENIHKLNEIEAVKSLKDKGIEEIYIQPIHVITGFEYEKLKNLGYKISKPLFHEQTDYKTLIGALEIEDNDDITIFVGHGSNHQADKYYSILEKNLQDIHGEKVFVSTIEGEDDFENLLKKLEKLENKSILLRPLMLVAGVHVRDDLSSSEENSWKSKLEKLGYKIDIDKRGLGELKGIRDIFVEKAEGAYRLMRKLDVIGIGPGASDLLTLRAVNRIKEADSIFVPVNKGKNLALDTVKEFIERKNIIELDFPMKKVTKSHYEKAAKIIDENLINRGVYLTIGDAMIYATSLYIADELAKLKTDIVLENVPGITSYLAAFNRVNLPLTLKGEKFLLIDDIENTPEKLLNEVDSIAVLKTYKNPEKIKEKLESYGFNPRYIQRLSMKEERVFEIDEEISGEKDYISLMVARKDR